MSPLKRIEFFFSLFYFQSFENLHISLLHFLRYLDNHLFICSLKRLLIRRFLRQQHRFDVYHLQAPAFEERIVADLLYVSADSYLRKLLITVKSFCADRGHFISNTLYLDHCRYCYTLRFFICLDKAYLCSSFRYFVLAACYGVFCTCLWISKLFKGFCLLLTASITDINDLSIFCIGWFCPFCFFSLMSDCIRFLTLFQERSAIFIQLYISYLIYKLLMFIF